MVKVKLFNMYEIVSVVKMSRQDRQNETHEFLRHRCGLHKDKIMLLNSTSGPAQIISY